MSAPLLDPNGHLNAAGISAFKTAGAGQAPQAVASHLARCASCQERLLLEASPRPRSGRHPLPVAPSPGRTILLLALTVLSILVALVSLRWLVGR